MERDDILSSFEDYNAEKSNLDGQTSSLNSELIIDGNSLN
jgi:hypothetical protein